MTASAELWDVLAGPVLDVAPRLLNAVVRHGEVAVRLTEVEAYDGASDPGSHAYRGRTRRNATMFGPPGTPVLLLHVRHARARTSSGRTEGTSSALLLRAGEVVGLDAACASPSVDRPRPGEGTGLAVHRAGHRARPRRHRPGYRPRDARARATRRGGAVRPRVGLRGAPERPWRFWIGGGAERVGVPPREASLSASPGAPSRARACGRVVGGRGTPDLNVARSAANVLPVAASGSQHRPQGKRVGCCALRHRRGSNRVTRGIGTVLCRLPRCSGREVGGRCASDS